MVVPFLSDWMFKKKGRKCTQFLYFWVLFKKKKKITKQKNLPDRPKYAESERIMTSLSSMGHDQYQIMFFSLATKPADDT